MSDTPWTHFSRSELECHCGCDRMEMDPEFMGRLEELRSAFGKPMRITSAYRCPDHNTSVSKTGRSGPHTTGRAVDVRVHGADAKRLLFLAAPKFSGMGVSQRGAHENRFIHLDNLPAASGRPRPWFWSY